MPPGTLPTRRDLLLQGLLHLPRLASQGGIVDAATARDEIQRLRQTRAIELAPLRFLAQPTPAPARVEDLEIRVVDPLDAATVLGHFHYLRSPRPDSVSIGAVYAGRIAALCSLSPLDLPWAGELPLADPSQALVVSRVFAFDWAPRNAISYMLARAEKLTIAKDAPMLVTYLNPNMGFSGASYKAANWLPLGLETGTRYAYLNGAYITDREVARLSKSVRMDLEYSRMPLRPLRLLCRLRDRRLRRAYGQGLGLVVERPTAPLAPRT